MFLPAKIFVAMQFFCCTAFATIPHSPLEKYSDQWNNAYFLSANTANNATYLNKEEILAIHILNLARLSPRLFAATVIEPLARKGYSPELASLMETMNAISTLKIIYPIAEIKQPFLQQTEKGSKNQLAELALKTGDEILISTNNNDPVQLIINLLIDTKDNLKTTRNYCLGDFNYLSISIQPTKDGYKSALRFKNSKTEKTVATGINKKVTTELEGESKPQDDDLTNGYSLTKTRQEIYKDNDTRIIEQLVIPWLLYYTNRYRKENGLDTLKYDACLLKAATYQTDYLFNESKKSHQFQLAHIQNPKSEWFKGESPSDRALTAGCKKYCGENALYTTISAISSAEFKNKKNLNLKAQKIARDMVYDQWHNSKGHRENMLNEGYTCLGVSVAIGKRSVHDNDIHNIGEQMDLNDDDSISWIAFGIQVLAY